MLEPIPFVGYMEIDEMNNKPVAWIDKNTGKPRMEGFIQTDHDIPLYAHPHPNNLGLAESIIKQQQLEIEALTDKLHLAKQSLEIIEGWVKK